MAELLFLGESVQKHALLSKPRPKRVYQKLLHIAILHLLQQSESTTLSPTREYTKQTNKTQSLEKLD